MIEQITREPNLCITGKSSTFLQNLCPPGSLELLTASVQMGIWTLFALTWDFWLWVLDYPNKLPLKKQVYRRLSGTCALPSRRKEQGKGGRHKWSFFPLCSLVTERQLLCPGTRVWRALYPQGSIWLECIEQGWEDTQGGSRQRRNSARSQASASWRITLHYCPYRMK